MCNVVGSTPNGSFGVWDAGAALLIVRGKMMDDDVKGERLSLLEEVQLECMEL